MNVVEKPATGLKGLRVAAFESRRGPELAQMVRRRGGTPYVVPALRPVPLKEAGGAATLAKELTEGSLDAVVFMTETGLQTFLDSLPRGATRARVKAALKKTALAARDAKIAKALSSQGFKVRATAGAPHTWREVVAVLERASLLTKKRLAVVEYGVPHVPFLEALEARGAAVLRAPLYRWGLPEDLGPLQDVLRKIMSGEIDAVLFSNANQVIQIRQLVQDMGWAEEFKASLASSLVAAVGPACADKLESIGWPADMVPSRPNLESLLEETAARGPALLVEKRRQGARVLFPKSPPVNPVETLSDSLFLRACRREPVERTPIWLMRQAGRYMKNYRALRSKVPMLELCKHPDLVAEVTVDAVQRLGVDAAILFSDLLLVVEPLGLSLAYEKGEGPRIRPALRSAADVKKLRPVHVEESLGYVLEAVRKTRAALPAHVPLIGFAGAPFTLASYLIEGEGSRNYVATKSFMYHAPEAWHALLSKLAALVGDFLGKQARAGAQALQVFDSWVGCLSPQDYRQYVLPHTRAVFQALPRNVPTIHFGTQTGALLELMKEAGGTVMGLDWRVNLRESWARLGEAAVMGNLDPVALFSSPQHLRGEARRILAEAGGRPGHIFNLGHGILPETPMDNVLALVEAVKSLSAK